MSTGLFPPWQEGPFQTRTISSACSQWATMTKTSTHFNGSSVEFIRRFEADYGAKPALPDRQLPLHCSYHRGRQCGDRAGPAEDEGRASDPRRPGAGEGSARRCLDTDKDPVAGRSSPGTLPVGDTPISQAQAAIAELKRLARLNSDWSWSDCAVVAREWRYLDPVRSLCDLEEIPVQMANEEFSGVWHLRETQSLVNRLRGGDSRLVKTENLNDWLIRQRSNPWTELLQEAVTEYALETSGAETLVDHFIEWLAEWGRDVRRRQRGLLLTDRPSRQGSGVRPCGRAGR